MPTTTPNSNFKVLVTGTNGYVALWVVRRLLEKGYWVRGTVRAISKAGPLKEYFGEYGDRFEVVVVEDITKEGAFDEAVKGIDAIEHIASPVHLNAGDPQEIIQPAVNGTLAILKSAVRHAPNAKRIVITSSCAAVITVSDAPRTFNEEDWNNASVKEIEERGRDATPITKYRASKTLAEKAAWDFYNQHKDEVNWDLTVLAPPFVFGPPIQRISSPAELNASMNFWWSNVVAEDTPRTPQSMAISNAWVDVKDLAEAHVLALEAEEAGGERIIICQGPYTWQEWLEVANSVQPSPLPNHKLPTGFPDIERTHMLNFDTSKAKRIFGITYRSKAETTRDILEDFDKRGW